MRWLATLHLVFALAIPSLAEARTRVLVLPLPESDTETAVFDARLVVALDETGRVTALTPAEEPECVTVECLAALGATHDADKVLSVTLLREEGTFTLFATLVGVEDRSLARTEITGLDAGALAKRAPAELARWVGGAQTAKPVVVGVAVPATGVPRDLALGFVDRLKAKGFTTAALERKEDRTQLTHRAEITITSLAIVKKRHHVRRYLDGAMIATVTVTDLATREVAFTRTVNVTASKRARYSSATEIAGLLAAKALDEWMDAFNLSGRNR